MLAAISTFRLLAAIVLLGCAARTPVAQPATRVAAEPVACQDVSNAGVEPESPHEWRFRDERDGHECNFADRLPALDEHARTRPPEVYRFLWLRAFDPPVAIRLEILPDERGLLTAEAGTGEADYTQGRCVTRQVLISRDEMMGFRTVLVKSDFWQSRAEDERRTVTWGKRAALLAHHGWRQEGNGLVAPIVYRPESRAVDTAIVGRVTDLESGVPILLATVIATSAALGAVPGEFTDANGRYELRDLPAGSNKLTFIYGNVKIETSVEIGTSMVAQVDAALDTSIPEIICLDGAEWNLEGVKHGATRICRVHCPNKDDSHLKPALWLINHSNLDIPPDRIY